MFIFNLSQIMLINVFINIPLFLVVTIILVYISSLRKTVLTDFHLDYPFDIKISL